MITKGHDVKIPVQEKEGAGSEGQAPQGTLLQELHPAPQGPCLHSHGVRRLQLLPGEGRGERAEGAVPGAAGLARLAGGVKTPFAFPRLCCFASYLNK